MNLYRFEAIVNGKRVPIVISADSHESAFEYAEMELERSFVQTPVIDELTLLEKRIIKKGGGFVLL